MTDPQAVESTLSSKQAELMLDYARLVRLEEGLKRVLSRLKRTGYGSYSVYAQMQGEKQVNMDELFTENGIEWPK